MFTDANVGDIVYDTKTKINGIITHTSGPTNYNIKVLFSTHDSECYNNKGVLYGSTQPSLRYLTEIKKEKEIKMDFSKTKKVAESASINIMNETVDMAKVAVGRIIYNNIKVLFASYLPQPNWIIKLFTSKDKRDIAELMAVYALLHLVKAKYSHYIIDCLTVYINLELQTKLIGVINIKDLDNIFKLPIKN